MNNSELRKFLITLGFEDMAMLDVIKDASFSAKQRDWLLLDEDTDTWQEAHDIAANKKEFDVHIISEKFSKMLIEEAIKLLEAKV